MKILWNNKQPNGLFFFHRWEGLTSPKHKANPRSSKVPQSLPATEKPNNCTNTSNVEPIQPVKPCRSELSEHTAWTTAITTITLIHCTAQVSSTTAVWEKPHSLNKLAARTKKNIWRGKKETQNDSKLLCEYKGFNWKEKLNDILNGIQPDIVILIEAKVSKKVKLKFLKYTAFIKSNGFNKREGFIISVTFISANAETTETENPNAYTLKLQTSKRSFCVIVAYGPQEHKTKSVREKFYDDFRTEVERSNINNDSIIIVGDVNTKLGKTIIPKRYTYHVNKRKSFKRSRHLTFIKLN